MRWLPLESHTWESPHDVAELQRRLQNCTERSRLFAARRHVEYLGTVSETGFRVSPILWGQTSFLPQIEGRWQDAGTGTLIDIQVVPNGALRLMVTLLFAFLGILVYDAHWGRVLLTTGTNAALAWLLLQVLHRAAVGVVEQRLRPLLEAVPTARAMTAAPSRTSPTMDRIAWVCAMSATAIGAGIWWQIYAGRFAITPRPAVDLVSVYWTTLAVLAAWLVWFSGLSPATQFRCLATLVVLEIGWTCSFVVDGYAGDGRPLLTMRWAHRRGAYQQPLEVVSMIQHTAARVDLFDIGPHDFAEFRGPRRDGVVVGTQLDFDWDRSPPKILWQQPVGAGWSSFAVAGEFAVTQEQRGEDEAVVCYETATGRVCWEHRDRAHFQEMMGGNGPRATPTIHDGNVYALGATGILNCLAGRDGSVLWTVKILEDNHASNAPFGMTGSPLIWRDVVIVTPGGKGASVAAYDRRTGQRRWGAGDAPAAYAAPQLVRLADVDQVLIFNAEGVFAHAPVDGRILWSYPWLTPPEWNNVCQPVIWRDEDGQDCVFIASGYGKGCVLLEVSLIRANWTATPRWRNTSIKPKFTSVVERDGYVYGLDENILGCVNLQTGRRCWKGGRYGFGQILLVDDTLLVLTEEGEIVLCAATPEEHRELSRLPVLNGRTWNHPALAGDKLLLRNDRLAACLQLIRRSNLVEKVSR